MNRINIKLILIIPVVLFLGIYFLYQVRWYLLGPEIVIDSPRPGEITNDSYLSVKGRAFNISSLSMNGRQIFTDERGVFSEGLLLARGYNIIEITANDKFGRISKEKREVILE
ncbi:MAG: hypothetical protein COY22_02785 [Candidatus Tagabacteria bacterium CG_4_10_14_0_2_um_filter_40_13]|uniref:Uncharacterized protein n=2 Tax=Candidatus Tagaibacteriota TaxID=1817918 RepID=A0A2M7B9J8_9BACT|nr:MAG: hypothetical protein COV90_01190 [Candidatus Tagabacteria bacterium CG11_big_fil_rev_8_21_14_0_20_41_11]PIU99751.1 MAG: hypothetical protein COS58_00560 [Candidatus Tagabacteria bacterium CG03_land_8_20_14_0_80_41_22]PIZ55990.1 MAG: hypothetical protein COY22_02785 [Candidatus Tagabacteria bacterium CG_4_10_14_0_2_um_filter_40_13]PJC25081.1 MAG: hypothetical protein CO056_02210 [Candidatus Tagabacteria bacterium CG_4_9_14_0_2_um_filter_41_11]